MLDLLRQSAKTLERRLRPRRRKDVLKLTQKRVRRGATPVLVDAPIGMAQDGLDTLPFLGAFDDTDQMEATTARMFADAKSDPAFAKVLVEAYFEEDLQASFARCQSSSQPTAVHNLLSALGVGPRQAIADIGSGRGHFPYALSKLGRSDITVMEPNSNWHSGTGYLRSLTDHDIKIINDLNEWRTISGRFSAVVSYATVHHWQHIPQAMIDTRRVLKPGGYWVMASEFFASTANELVAAMLGHGTAMRYNCYEWPYPASVYADLAASVGLQLAGVIPTHYRGNAFLVHPSPKKFDHAALDKWIDENLLLPGGTVEAFWDEVDAFRRVGDGERYYTAPQVMIFRRVAA